MKIYNVLVEYTNFEDEDSNYSEIRACFSKEELAIEYIGKVLKDELDNEMVYRENNFKPDDYKEDLKQQGYLHLEQDFGFGETRIILSENELDLVENYGQI